MCTETKQPHKHAELIIAWAKGAEIEYKTKTDWLHIKAPRWVTEGEYRIKPVPKPDVIVNSLMKFRNMWKTPLLHCSWNGEQIPDGYRHNLDLELEHIRFIFDGETGKLKSVSLL